MTSSSTSLLQLQQSVTQFDPAHTFQHSKPCRILLKTSIDTRGDDATSADRAVSPTAIELTTVAIYGTAIKHSRLHTWGQATINNQHSSVSTKCIDTDTNELKQSSTASNHQH
jgi:hypothetical protein